MSSQDSVQNPVFKSSGKLKKHLEKSNKYPMRLCQCCNIMVVENYLSNHKKTTKHKQKLQEYNDNTNIEYLNNKISDEIKDLENKLTSFMNGKEEIIESLQNLEEEYNIIQNEYNKYSDMLSLKKYEIKQMKIEDNNLDEAIKKVDAEINAKKLLSTYFSIKTDMADNGVDGQAPNAQPTQ
jgi:hypothetical protein